MAAASLVGLVSLLQLIPAAILAPIGSVLGDRHRRERVLLFAYASLSAMTALAALALLTDAPAPLVYASATSAGWLITLIRPTHSSLLPRLARTPEELSSAYAASSLLESFSILLGPLLAGALMGLAPGSLSGPGVVDAAMAVLLLLGTLSVASIRVRTEPAHAGGTSGVRVVAADAVDGVRAVARDRRSLLLVLTMGLALVQLGFVDVLIVILAFDVLGTGDAGVGFLTASIGVGAVVGAAFAIGLAARWRSSRSFRWGVSWSGISIAGIAAQPPLAGVFLAMSGAGGALAEVNGRVMLQRLIPDKQLSRAFGVLESLYMAGEGVGSFLASLLVVALGTRWILLLAGVLLPAVALLGRRAFDALDVGIRIPSEEMALLRSTRIFAPLPTPMLERLARNLIPISVPVGSAVITQGEAGDRFYAIIQGTVEVLVDGRAITTLGPGGSFGEIALIRDVPRTATVVATTESKLLALDRDEFLRAIVGHEDTSDAAHGLATERLEETGVVAGRLGRVEAGACGSGCVQPMGGALLAMFVRPIRRADR
jgi:CRP-like cAMP-binding protein/predicted MFS family arabinose efflux permease